MASVSDGPPDNMESHSDDVYNNEPPTTQWGMHSFAASVSHVLQSHQSGLKQILEMMLRDYQDTFKAFCREFTLIHTELVQTKADWDTTTNNLNALRAEMNAHKQEMQDQMDAFKVKLRNDLDAQEAETRANSARQNTEIYNLRARMTNTLAIRTGERLVQMHSLVNHQPIAGFPETANAIDELTDTALDDLLGHLQVPVPATEALKKAAFGSAISVGYVPA